MICLLLFFNSLLTAFIINNIVSFLTLFFKSSKEIIPCMVTQICENVENCSVVDFYKDFKLSKQLYGDYELFNKTNVNSTNSIHKINT